VVFGRQYSTYDRELAVLVEVFVYFRKEGSAILNLRIFFEICTIMGSTQSAACILMQ
jgi:hypothetical protein